MSDSKVMEEIEAAITKYARLAGTYRAGEPTVDQVCAYQDLYMLIESAIVAARREALVQAAAIAKKYGEPYALHANTGAMMFRACTEKIVTEILALPRAPHQGEINEHS